MPNYLPKSILTLIIAASLFAGCAGNRETIHIISTNDTHGGIDNIPSLATLVNEYRAQDTAAVLLVDAGDRWTGNPFVDMAPEPGRPIMELMDMLGYDVVTFGNHEFDRGLAHLEKRNSEVGFDFVLANISTGDTPLSQPEPYKIYTTPHGTRIAILGLITNFINGHPDGKDEIFEGTFFPSPYRTAEEYSPLKQNTDVFIALTHIGDDADSVLAVRVPVFDLIIGGHTHVAMKEPRVYGKTYVTQTGSRLKYAGVTTITMRGKRVKSIDNHLVRLDTVAPDPAFSVLLNRYYDNETLKKPIGSLAADMDKSGVVNMMTDVIRRDMKADFALYHIGGVRVDGFPNGGVNTADMYAVEPFESRAVKVRMTLPQIRELIMNKFNDTENARESHHEDIFPSGMKYTIVTDERGDAVDVTFDHSLPYQAETLYSVAMSDYMYKIYRFDKPEIESTSPLITDMLADEFKKHSPVKPDNTMRVSIRMR